MALIIPVVTTPVFFTEYLEGCVLEEHNGKCYSKEIV